MLLKYYFKVILEFISSLEFVISPNKGFSSQSKCDEKPWESLHEQTDISTFIAGPLLEYLCSSSRIFPSGFICCFLRFCYLPFLLHSLPFPTVFPTFEFFPYCFSLPFFFSSLFPLLPSLFFSLYFHALSLFLSFILCCPPLPGGIDL